ncbi:hypothetical protein BDP27DRAFT_1430658 [Rhodocollybia butyracea]|uniref:Uncharacterized protein n=1 Tax=Rhodocollybia butyracea TaxID=206335 RepID=A0A9P5PAK8_9AGAR|nr:hypothetical protein BDP27DRAFT_1430658 [Rhodocollybia butyracea]
MPQWNTIARCLKIPALSKNDFTVHPGVDHISPWTWRGDISVANVTVLTTWRLGQSKIESKFLELKNILNELPEGTNILRPFSIDVVKKPPLDIDDSLDLQDDKNLNAKSLETIWEEALSMASEESAVDTTFLLDGKNVFKEAYLKTASAHLKTKIISSGTENMLNIHSPIATMIWSDNHLFLHLNKLIDPDVSTNNIGKPTYLFESTILCALTASLLEALDAKDGSFVPEVKPSPKFPYKEGGGQDCFVCKADGKECQILDDTLQKCTYCTPSVSLPAAGPHVIEHVAAHLLFDPKVSQDSEPCGLCLFPYGTFKWRLNQARNQIKWKKSKCVNMVKFKDNTEELDVASGAEQEQEDNWAHNGTASNKEDEAQTLCI